MSSSPPSRVSVPTDTAPSPARGRVHGLVRALASLRTNPAVIRVVADAIALGVFLALADRYWPDRLPGTAALGATVVVWLIGSFILVRFVPAYVPLLGLRLGGLAAAFLGRAALNGTGLTTADLILVLLTAAAVATPWAFQSRLGAGDPDARDEPLRVALILAFGFFLFESLARPVIHGSGDAVWYAMNAADMLAQVRSGVFPVFSGQSIYQFNGSLYPLRIAPAFHYLCAGFDLLTGRTLSPYAVLTLFLSSWGLLAALTAYLSFAALLPRARWIGLLAGALFVACPGVMGIVYNTDLYMSWTTVPFIPLAFAATALSFRRPTRRTLILLAVALGATWWGHTPIALWASLCAGVLQLIRLAGRRLSKPDRVNLALAAGVFAAVALFPIGGALLFKPEASANVTGFQSATPGALHSFVAEVFPAVLRPLDLWHQPLAAFQLGYGLWGVAAASLLFVGRSRLALGLTGAVVLVILLLTPIPGLNLALWTLVPGFIRNPTGNWAMNRLYLILAGLLLTLASVLWHERRPRAGKAVIAGLALVAACLWSAREAHRFGEAASYSLGGADSIRRQPLEENVSITQFAYLVFPQVPAFFSQGAVDPQLEQRFYSDDGRLLWSNSSAILDRAAAHDPRAVATNPGPFQVRTSAPDVFDLAAPLRLEPGHRYLLHFHFPSQESLTGIVQIIGRTTLREYTLPVSGGVKAFGSGPAADPTTGIWSSAPGGDSVQVRLIRQDPTAAGAMAQVTLEVIDYDPALLPARVTRWIPYTVTVRSPEPGWLETPRSFQRFWTTDSGKQDVKRSPEALVMLRAVGRGESHRLTLDVPVLFTALFWLATLVSAGAWGWLLIRPRTAG